MLFRFVRARKSQELNETQATVNRAVQEAEGYRQQAKFRGDAYFESKKNEAEGILATGRAEVEGLKEQIQALSGEGGIAILKLRFANELMKNSPQFVVMGESSGSGDLNVRKVDTNELLKQIGVFEAMKDKPKSESRDELPQ